MRCSHTLQQFQRFLRRPVQTFPLLLLQKFEPFRHLRHQNRTCYCLRQQSVLCCLPSAHLLWFLLLKSTHHRHPLHDQFRPSPSHLHLCPKLLRPFPSKLRQCCRWNLYQSRKTFPRSLRKSPHLGCEGRMRPMKSRCCIQLTLQCNRQCAPTLSFLRQPGCSRRRRCARCRP